MVSVSSPLLMGDHALVSQGLHIMLLCILTFILLLDLEIEGSKHLDSK
jgi:hypothetical protein